MDPRPHQLPRQHDLRRPVCWAAQRRGSARVLPLVSGDLASLAAEPAVIDAPLAVAPNDAGVGHAPLNPKQYPRLQLTAPLDEESHPAGLCHPLLSQSPLGPGRSHHDQAGYNRQLRCQHAPRRSYDCCRQRCCGRRCYRERAGAAEMTAPAPSLHAPLASAAASDQLGLTGARGAEIAWALAS